MLDAIVARLSARVAGGNALERKVSVRAIDDTVIGDITEYTTVSAPAILVTCLGWPTIDDDAGETPVDITFIARCIARVSDKPEGEDVRSRGDVAMNLAALVTRVVESTELWPDAEGNPTASMRARRTQARNMGSRALSQKNLSMWVVTWTQRVDITGEDEAQLLAPFKHFGIHIAMGGDNTPETAVELELEGATPP
jgi:hypothetical protein